MLYDTTESTKEFNRLMVEIRRTIPVEYEAFLAEKAALTKEGLIDEKTKWLLVMVAAVSQKCPICVGPAVKHCLEAGWSKAEILEAAMTAVLMGGSSVMTYVTLAAKAIEDNQK